MQEHKTYTINSITPIYDNIEDRIRLAINYQDIENRIDLMVTRSFIIKILSAFEEYIYKYYPSDIHNEKDFYIDDLSKKLQRAQSSIKKNDNITQLQNRNMNPTDIGDIKLYQSLEDLLLSISLKYDKVTKKTKLEFFSKKNYTCTLTLDIVLLKQIIASIKQSIPRFEWGISLQF